MRENKAPSTVGFVKPGIPRLRENKQVRLKRGWSVSAVERRRHYKSILVGAVVDDTGQYMVTKYKACRQGVQDMTEHGKTQQDSAGQVSKGDERMLNSTLTKNEGQHDAQPNASHRSPHTRVHVVPVRR